MEYHYHYFRTTPSPLIRTRYRKSEPAPISSDPAHGMMADRAIVWRPSTAASQRPPQGPCDGASRRHWREISSQCTPRLRFSTRWRTAVPVSFTDATGFTFTLIASSPDRDRRCALDAECHARLTDKRQYRQWMGGDLRVAGGSALTTKATTVVILRSIDAIASAATKQGGRDSKAPPRESACLCRSLFEIARCVDLI